MNRSYVRLAALVLAVGLVVGSLVLMNRAQPTWGAAEQRDRPMTGPHYTVVETEGHNLIVTDNDSNTLYFYTVDKGKPPGSEMKMRGKVDLKQIGKDVIVPADVNLQK